MNPILKTILSAIIGFGAGYGAQETQGTSETSKLIAGAVTAAIAVGNLHTDKPKTKDPWADRK